MFDAIVVGSGPAGTFCAYELRGKNVLVLDVGQRPEEVPKLNDNQFRLRQRNPDLFDELIGEHFESLHNIHRPKISLKLKAPFQSYIIRDWERLSPLVSSGFDAVMSFAQGGLANAWGAGVYRFTSSDLEGFPITAAELEPFYDELTEHIGISGANDDLAPYFGHDPRLLPPLSLSPLAAEILDRYGRRKAELRQKGISLGHARLAVLTVPHRGREAYRYDNLEFFQPHNSAIYNPAYTLNELVKSKQILYKPGYLVTRYRETEAAVEVEARNLDSGCIEKFYARCLLLAAGALSTTKLVLNSNGDCETRLPILDNPMSCIPLFRWNRIGEALDIHETSLAQLNLIYEAPAGNLLQGTLYGTGGPLRSDILFELPLSISANLVWTKYLAPAMALLMMFYPAKLDPENYIRLRSDDQLEIHYKPAVLGESEKHLIAAFRRLGCFSAMRLCQYPRPGASLHYGGTLPMKEHPGRYQTDSNGRLQGTQSVYVTDGACFTQLPAKNLTFTIMANAMRIASRIRSGLD